MTEKTRPEENTQVSDQEDYGLIEEFLGGDDSAFTRLVIKHRDKVKNLIYLTLGDTDLIDDISQEVFLNIYRKLDNFRFESKFTTWLYRITVNKCRDQLRKKKVRSIFTPITESERELRTRDNPENVDLPNLVRKAIFKLPEKLKEPLVLRDIEGLSYKEIAEQMETEVGTIKSRIFRARESLKIILEPYQKELGY